MGNKTIKKIMSGLAGWKLLANTIKAVTGIVGASLILTENHPYWSLTVLAIGAAANEVVMFFNSAEEEDKPNV